MIKVLVADSHPIIIKGIIAFLSEEKRLHVQSAHSSEDCLKISRAWKPQVVILDKNLIENNDFQLMDQLVNWSIKVIVFADQVNKDQIISWLVKGVKGILFKDCGQKEMIKALVKVVNNELHFSPDIYNHIQTSSFLDQTELDVIQTLDLLTKKEKEILFLIANGLQNKEIASKMGIKTRTVEFHVSNLLSKLGVTTRVEAAIFYLKEIGGTFSGSTVNRQKGG